ncbi:MAG: YgiW/YdeI family stress tolerance OB fold protein [Aeromonadaceae bacterium]
MSRFFMKKVVLCISLFPLLPLDAAFTGDVIERHVQISKALKLPDDSYVTLHGFITKHLSDDSYLFMDSSGSITVEIEHDIWRGLDVSPLDHVRIRGKIDKNWNRPEVEVDYIEKL